MKNEGVVESSHVSLGMSVLEQSVVTVVVSSGEMGAQVAAKGRAAFKEDLCGSDLGIGNLEPELCAVKISGNESLERCGGGDAGGGKTADLSRSGSSQEHYCRVCQQQAEEALIDLGCQCRGGIAKAHRSCIDIWFHTKGSNKCEICHQVATNVPPPVSQPSRNYWVWRVNPPTRGSGVALVHERERGCYSPLIVAFSILIGGLLLDVLISISLGVSALPVNIIIGVLVLLGLGTALRLALECCHEVSLRRAVQSGNTNDNIGP